MKPSLDKSDAVSSEERSVYRAVILSDYQDELGLQASISKSLRHFYEEYKCK